MRPVTKIILSLLILLVFFLWSEIARTPSDQGARIYFIDVGQGDAILVQKGTTQVLIDGGPSEAVLPVLGKVMPLTDRKIEYVVLTHPHADHLAGISAVIGRYEVGEIYTSGALHTSDMYLKFLEMVRSEEITLKIPGLMEVFEPFANGRIEFLWPGDRYLKQTVENLNNASIVSRFCYFERCALFTGDIESDEQARMFGYYESEQPAAEWQSTILKAPHHGASNGTSMIMYEKVLPKYTIFSAGADNKYGHPHKSSLDLAEKYRSQILRTDQDGTIEFLVGEEGIARVK